MKSSRRTFFDKTIMLVGGLCLAPVLARCSKKPVRESSHFVHHVFFWLKEPDNEEVLSKFEAALHELASIETVRIKHIGRPADTNREVIDNTYSFSLLVIFDDKEGHDIYQVHSKHKEFIEQCKDMWKRVLVYDTID